MAAFAECPSCHARVKGPDKMAGQTARCPRCGLPIIFALPTAFSSLPLPPIPIPSAPSLPTITEAEPAEEEYVPSPPRRKSGASSLLIIAGALVAFLILVFAARGLSVPSKSQDSGPGLKEGVSVLIGGALGGSALTLLIFPFVAVYLLPTIIAFFRGHPNTPAIAVVNVFFGITIIGWGVALAWAFTAFKE